MKNLLPLISIIIPVYPGAKNPLVLASLERLDYPQDQLEIFLSEGFAPSRQRNQAAQQARGEYLVFFDDDVSVPSDYLRVMLHGYRTWNASGLGGPCIPIANRSAQQQAIAYSLGSWWALGLLQARYKKMAARQNATDKQLILCNMSLRRDLFIRMGGFCENLYPNEENELLDRLRRHGHSIGYSPGLAVQRPADSTLMDHWRRMFRYGQGRAYQFKTNSSFRNLEHLLVVSSISVVGLSAFCPWPLGRWLGFIYLLWLLGATLHGYWHLRTLQPALWIGGAIAGTHFAYAAGFWHGLLTKMKKPAHFSTPEITISKIPSSIK